MRAALALGTLLLGMSAQAQDLVPLPLLGRPVLLEAAYLRDSNINRGPDAGPRHSDDVFSLNASMGRPFSLHRHVRLVATGTVGGEKHADAGRLDRATAAARAELQYRGAGTFFAPTFGAFARLAYDHFDSDLRSGQRRTLGLNARQPLTDRLELFGTLARETRRADHEVFEGRFNAARANLDYALGPGRGTFYLGAERRRGDAVSSVPSGFENVVPARAWVADDAFDGLYAYRYEARTTIWTLGYNRALGPRSALDVFARRIEARPDGAQAWGMYGAGSARYSANQLSAAYLLRF